MQKYYLSSEINDYLNEELLRDIDLVKDVINLYKDDYEDIPSLNIKINVLPTDIEKLEEIFNLLIDYENRSDSLIAFNYLDAVKIYNVWKNHLILVTNQRSLICACETLGLKYTSIDSFIDKIREVCYDLVAS